MSRFGSAEKQPEIVDYLSYNISEAQRHSPHPISLVGYMITAGFLTIPPAAHQPLCGARGCVIGCSFVLIASSASRLSCLSLVMFKILQGAKYLCEEHIE